VSTVVVAVQQSTELVGISEHHGPGAVCGAAIEREGVCWYCTRRAFHEHPVHAAHYEDDRGRSMIGVSWVEES
jgi:hypothetical protein